MEQWLEEQQGRRVSKRNRPLVRFNAAYYAYPISIRSARYPTDSGLSVYDRELRDEWLVRVAAQSNSEFALVVTERFRQPEDSRTLRLLLTQHGVFAERFFHRAIRGRIARQFAESRIDLHDVGRLLSLSWGYDVKMYGNSDAIFRIIDHIYEQTLVRAIRKPEVNGDVGAWFEQLSKPRTCVVCSNEFRVIDLPDWVYFGSNGFQDCCFQCPILGRPRKAELMRLAPEFVQSCGFIPNADASPINYAFTSRLSGANRAEVFHAYGRMGGTEHVKKKFGSWFKGLVETCSVPEGVQSTARGVRCLAEDGHVCHSLDEQRIDNWLFAKKLSHEREPQYPPHPTLNASGSRRADWKVGDTFIEYFGLVGDADYERKMDEKIMLSTELQIDMIAIYPSDLERIEKRLGFLVTEDLAP